MMDLSFTTDFKPVSKGMFFDAMSSVPQAVFIVTTDGIEGKAGLTATAVTSVSADPPSLLVCLNASNSSTMAFFKNKSITINSLSGEQAALATMFGKSAAGDLIDPTPEQLREAREQRFEADVWDFESAPVLKGARAVFECDISDVKIVDTHLVIFAKVVSIRLGTGSSGLVYMERGYRIV